MKTALLFVDEEAVKIVFGISLKTIKMSELVAPHNKRILEQIFSQYKVLIVDKVSELSKDDFESWIKEVQEIQKPAPKPEPTIVTTALPGVVTAATPQKTATKLSRATAEILKEAEEDSNRMLFRLTEETTMIIDDLPTGEDIPGLPGVRKTLAIHPWKAVDLAALPQDSIKASGILKRLIREGKLVPCTTAEAIQIEQDHDRQLKLDNDARLEQASPIIDEKAEAFASRLSKGGRLDINAKDADTMEITDDSPLSASKGEMSLTDLMKIAGASDEAMPDFSMPVAPPEATPKRQLAARPAVQSDGLKPKGIGRRHREE